MSKVSVNDKYKSDGVDVEAGDVFSKICFNLCRETFGNSRFVEVLDLSRGNFRGPRGFNFVNLLPGCVPTMVGDGLGTKSIPIVASGKVETAASNVIAMTAMDITRYGGLPLVFINIFDVRTLGGVDSDTFAMCTKIMDGLKNEADKHGYVLLGGETAELGPCVGSENPKARLMFNWGGVMAGVYHPEKMILGNTVRPGQKIISLRDYFRSNGFGSVRKAFHMYGYDWYDNPLAIDDIIAASSPSIQYDRLFNYANGWLGKSKSLYGSAQLEPVIPVHLIVHLSGGAFKSKLGDDILKPLGLSAVLDDLFEPPAIMRKCAEWRGFSHEECYSTWNGGQGAICVVDEKDVSDFLTLAQEFEIDAKVSGEITEKRDYTVAIESKFGSKKTIYYH